MLQIPSFLYYSVAITTLLFLIVIFFAIKNFRQEINKSPTISFKVMNNKTGEIHLIKKIIIEDEGRIGVWSNTWYGHHIIGQDCKFVN